MDTSRRSYEFQTFSLCWCCTSGSSVLGRKSNYLAGYNTKHLRPIAFVCRKGKARTVCTPKLRSENILKIEFSDKIFNEVWEWTDGSWEFALWGLFSCVCKTIMEDCVNKMRYFEGWLQNKDIIITFETAVCNTEYRNHSSRKRIEEIWQQHIFSAVIT